MLVEEQEAEGAPVVVVLTEKEVAWGSGAQVTRAWLLEQFSSISWLWICGAHGAEEQEF